MAAERLGGKTEEKQPNRFVDGDCAVTLSEGIMKPSFIIVGGGKVGTALGRQLALNGYRPLGVASRRLESARKAAKIIGTEAVTAVPWEITPGVDLIFITTPDGMIAPVCDEIRKNQGFSAGSTVLHCSGALPSTILNVGEQSGVFTGSIHPLQSFAAVDPSGNPFSGIMAAVEGDAQAVRVAREVGETLGAVCFLIKTEAKTQYHAAAVVASNYLVTLMNIALRLLAAAGIEQGEAFAVLSPLIQGTLTNIQTVGVPEALTGPIARGDSETVARHVRAVGRDNRELGALYRQLGLATIPLAREKGTLSAEKEAALRKILHIF